MADLIQRWQNNGVLIEQWDDGTSTYTDFTTSPATQRPYTTQETADATARATGETRLANLAQIFTAANNARTNNLTYLGITSPTNAQVVAQVAALTRQMNGVIRVIVGELKGDLTALDGTN